MTDPDPTFVAQDVAVEDVFVDWQLNCSNTPELVVILEERLPQETWEPVDCDPEDDFWLVENDYGVFFGWQSSLPVSEETGMSTTTVEHESLGVVEDRYRAFDHVVSREQNSRDSESVFSVTTKTSKRGSPRSLVIRSELGQELVEKYLNGPLGTDYTSYWYWSRIGSDGYGFRQGPNSREDYEPYNDASVALVADGIYTWHPKRVSEVDPDDDVYGGHVVA